MPTNYLYLISIAEKIAMVALFCSACVGIVLVYLTLFAVRKIFGGYKYLIAIFTSFSIVLACMEVVFYMNLHFYNSGWTYFTFHRPLGWSKETMMAVLPIYSGTYSLTISLLAVQFVYRYWALFGLRYMVFFRGWRSLVWVAYCTFWAGTIYLGERFLLIMDEASVQYFEEEMLRRYNVRPREIIIKCFLAYDPQDGSVRWRDVSYTVILSITMAVQYATMMYCGWQMNSKMEEKIEGLSMSLKNHHRQLFKTLVLQISSPTILLFSPLIVLLYLPFFNIEVSIPAGAIFTAFNIYPLMDSVIVLCVVTEYRAAAKRKINAMCKKVIAWTTEQKDGCETDTNTKELARMRGSVVS